AGELVSAGGVDSAGRLTSAGISVAAGPTVPTEPSSPLRDPSKGKAVATPSSPDVRGLTDDQLRIVYDKIRRAADLATAKAQHQQLNRSGATLESSKSKKLKSSHNTTHPAELQKTTSVSAGATIAA
nr:hypothetical protein [Tanacetum cinerariifolium]